MKKSIVNKKKYYFFGIVLLSMLWQLFSMKFTRNTMIFPSPVSTFRYSFKLLFSSYTYRCIFASLQRMLQGFFSSLLFAFLLAIAAGNFDPIDLLMQPMIIALRSVPTASLVYLFIVLAGFRKAPVYIVFLIAFPILYENIKEGIHNTPEVLLKASRLDGAGFVVENLRIRIPMALPYIKAGISSAFSLCFKIEIMAEVITGASNTGLGCAIYGARSFDPTNMVPVFAYSLIAIALMLSIDYLAWLIKDQFPAK